MEKLFDVKDVLSRYGVTYPTLYRWRKNRLFPDTVGVGKLLWTESQLAEWENRKSTPVTPAVTGQREQRRKTKEFKARQDAADAALERHSNNRKSK